MSCLADRRHRSTPTGFSIPSAGAEDRCYPLVRRGLVEVFSDGRVLRRFGRHCGKPASYWTGHITQFYVVVRGVRYQCSAARLVWMHFNGPIPYGRVVVQIDGDRRNISAGNLMLVSEGRAMTLAHRHGRLRRAVGAANAATKLDESKVRAIRLRRMDNARLVDIAREFGISISTVDQVVTRRTWRHVA